MLERPSVIRNIIPRNTEEPRHLSLRPVQLPPELSHPNTYDIVFDVYLERHPAKLHRIISDRKEKLGINASSLPQPTMRGKRGRGEGREGRAVWEGNAVWNTERN